MSIVEIQKVEEDRMVSTNSCVGSVSSGSGSEREAMPFAVS